MTEQQKYAQASLHISWTLAKQIKSLTDADIVKKCMLSTVNVLLKIKRMLSKVFETFQYQHRLTQEHCSISEGQSQTVEIKPIH